MFCKNCGAKIAEDSLFCNVCGAKQNITDSQPNIDINTSKLDSQELTNEEIYQKDLKRTKKRLVIAGLIVAFVGLGIYGINNSVEAGPGINFATKVSAILGDADAEYKIGISVNGLQKIEWLEKAAKQGHADAQAYLGDCYYNGNGVVKDVKKGLEWFQKAADNGSVYGQFRMGWAYSQGEGVDKDLKLAVSWYRKASDNGNTAAMNNLAVCYDKGEGVQQDLKEAFRLYNKASEQGNILATLNLAYMYENGRGTNQDKNKAFELFKQVASRKDMFLSEENKKYISNAMYNVGRMYSWGIGVDKNLKEGIKYFELAKEKGNLDALCELGIAYYFGRGVPIDVEKGKKLIKESALQGNNGAKSFLKFID